MFCRVSGCKRGSGVTKCDIVEGRVYMARFVVKRGQ